MRDEDPFIAGLRRYFETHLNAKPATVSAEAGLNKSAIRKMLIGEVGSPRHENAVRIANVLGLTVERIIDHDFDDAGPSDRRMISVVGRVGAGALVDMEDPFPKGDGYYQVICPPQLPPHGIVAVEVVGDSMEPVYQQGSVLFYSRAAIGVPTEALGRICVCEDDAGAVWVKVVKVGIEEGTFSLLSTNPTSAPRHGIRLAWAAPVRFSLPPEFVERV